MHWSVETGKKIKDFAGHTGDVAALSLNPKDNKVFVTSSVDRTCRLWDLREDHCKQIFWGHTLDVNSINFHNNGQNFITCSEDKERLPLTSYLKRIFSIFCSACHTA